MLLMTVALFAFNTGLTFNIQHLLGNAARAFNMAIVSFLVARAVVGKIQGFPDEQVIYTRYFFI